MIHRQHTHTHAHLGTSKIKQDRKEQARRERKRERERGTRAVAHSGAETSPPKTEANGCFTMLHSGVAEDGWCWNYCSWCGSRH